MSYATTVANLYALGHELANQPAHKFDLAFMRKLLAALGSPEAKLPAVLIAGTNGKGSTAATLASILQAAGLRTGLYTSPHLVQINERIRINGIAVANTDFANLHKKAESAAAALLASGELPWHPSFFEMITAMAFLHFAEVPVDIAVLEVGMGGRLDATNVVQPRVSVIADVALDHQKYLGDTLTEIAREKAGIIWPGVVVVTLPQMPEANDAIGNAILERGARGVNAAQYVPPVSPNSAQSRNAGVNYQQGNERRFGQEYRVQVLGEEILVQTPLIGRHQLRNVALAIATAVELNQQEFKITPQDIERGIRETRWPGRFERIQHAGREFVLDVAHNPAGAWALRAALSEQYEDRPFTLVFGAMLDKAIGEMAEILFPLADRIIATRADNPRAAAPEEIRQAARRITAEIYEAPNVLAALQRAEAVTPSGGLVVVTGSIYIVGEAIKVLEMAGLETKRN